MLSFEILPYTYEISKIGSKLDAELIKSGKTLPFADITISATAIKYNLSLVTRDSQFQRIPKLKLSKY